MLKKGLSAIKERGNITYMIAVLIMVVMPMHYQYMPPLMIILFLGWIFENYNRFGEMIKIRASYKLLLVLFLIFYFWQVAGLFYTTDMKLGWANILTRLSFILFPLVFLYPGDKIKANIFKLLRVFAMSTALYILFCFGYALFRSLSIQNGIWLFNPHPPGFPWISYFYSMDLTYAIHPSYQAMFVLIAVFISLESWYDYTLNFFFRIGWLIIAGLLLISLYFISSRAAILAAIIMIPFYVLYKIIKLKKSRFILISTLIILILLFPLIRKNERVNILFDGFSKEQKFNLKNQDQRIIVWESAIKVIRDNFAFGVGVGDVKAELVKEYDRTGEDTLRKERLNTHNQFLEIFVENGVIGFLVFISLFGCLIYIAISDKNLLYGLFILMIFVSFMFEAILCRLAGVAFFALFSFLLLHIPKTKIQ